MYYFGAGTVTVVLAVGGFFVICLLKRLIKRMAKKFAKYVLEEEAEEAYDVPREMPEIRVSAPSQTFSKRSSMRRAGKLYPSVKSLRSNKSASLPAVYAHGKM